MTSPLPHHLQEEQRALEAEIREAFKGVTREGGVSWSEAEKRDGPCDEQQLAEARASDVDRNWTELADDENWDAGPGVGGWYFLDAIGFRYYLPAAMIRALNAGEKAFSSTTLDGPLMRGPDNYALIDLDERQRRCVARFMRFMIARETASNNDIDAEYWQEAYDAAWEKVDRP